LSFIETLDPIMVRSTQDREKRLAELKKEVTKRGFDRHASILSHVSELPTELQSPAVMAMAARESIQKIISFPGQIQRGWHYVPKQALLFTPTDVIHLAASIWPEDEPQVTCLTGCGLMYLKVTLVLLYGFLGMVAQGQDSPLRLGMEFNTVAWSYLSVPLRKLLQATQSPARSIILEKIAIYSQATQQVLEKLPIKFSNGVKIYGLLPGEDVEEFVFQPRTWRSWLYLFRRPVSPNTLLLLTTNYMVVIDEDLQVEQGWILSYIPRNIITGIQSQPGKVWNELSVQLERGDQTVDYKLMLKNEFAEAWHTAWTRHNGQWQVLPEQLA
jgi:hypothetical protein